jgi:dimeric dUTPase (all-alpha-NTP-PPase superfamily)
MEDKQRMKDLKIIKPAEHDSQSCRLCQIINQQDLFNKKFFDLKKLNLGDRIFWSMKMFMALSSELSEFWNWLPWKWWKKYQGETNIKEVIFELTDCFIFLLSLMMIWGMGCDEIYSYYFSKNEENIRRQKEGYNGTL